MDLQNQQNNSQQAVEAAPDEVAPQTLGEVLKERRQYLRMEIEDVAVYLRIKPHDILAIENDEVSRIAKQLYAPGLIRSYAKFLKIDEKTIEEKIKSLAFKSNTENKKHLLLNIGENIELTPSKDSFFNFLLISILAFLVLLSIYNSYEDKNSLITNQDLITNLEKIDS